MKIIEIDGRVYVMRRVRRGWTLVRAAAPRPSPTAAELSELHGIEVEG
jgi:hypothetical protein